MLLVVRAEEPRFGHADSSLRQLAVNNHVCPENRVVLGSAEIRLTRMYSNA